MAAKRHTGLGRGLDALFPEPEQEKSANATGDNKLQEESRKSPEKNRDTAEDRGTVMVRLSRIEPNRKQPRKYFDEQALEELAQSIRDHGLLQPILVQDRGSYYEIIAGERRWRAARKAGLREVPVIIRDYTDQEIMELSLIENIQREDLNPIEEARAYQMLIDVYHLTQSEAAQRVSKSRTAVANTMRLLKLDEAVQDMIIGGQLSMGQARALLGIDDKEKQRELAGRIIEQKMSVREVEKLVKHITSNQNTSKSTSDAQSTASTASDKKRKTQQESVQDEQTGLMYLDFERRLRETLNTKVTLHPDKNGSGKIVIEFYDGGDLERITDILTGH